MPLLSLLSLSSPNFEELEGERERHTTLRTCGEENSRRNSGSTTTRQRFLFVLLSEKLSVGAGAYLCVRREKNRRGGSFVR